MFLITIFTGSGQTTNSAPFFLAPTDGIQGTLQKDEVEKFQKFKENTNTYKSVTMVHTADISKFQKNKRIPFHLPGINGIPVARASKIEAKTLKDYTWKGDFENEHEGTVLLIAKEGEVFGQIRIDGKSYQLFSLKSGVSILLEINMDAMRGKHCDIGSVNDVDENTKLNEQKLEVKVRGCSDPRILVVASPQAETALGGFNGVQQLAQVAISQLNDVFENSDLNISAILTGVEILDGFIEPSTIVGALNLLITEAADEREDHFADLVVMITASYDDAVGIAQGLGPVNAFAIANEHVATNELAFVHEVGHLYGARHENLDCFTDLCQNCDNTQDYSHGYHFKTGIWPFRTDRWTVMRSCTNLTSVIEHFSNPSVEFKNKPTGVENLQDNARRVQNNRCAVGNLRGNPPPPMTATINGPIQAYNTGTHNWCVSVSNCSNVTFYAWEYSTDGFNYSPWNFQICKNASMPFNEDLYLRVTATCSDGRTAIDYHFTNNLDIPNQLSNPIPTLGTETINPNIYKNFDVLISPNPITGKKISFTLKIPENGSGAVVLMDILGRKVYTVSDGEFQKGSINISKPLPTLSSGMYFLRTIWKNQSITRKVIIP